MADHFDRASDAARSCASKLLKRDIPATIIADGLITQGLAAWAAETSREQDAQLLLAVWAHVRDYS